jgi:hypothetical protein
MEKLKIVTDICASYIVFHDAHLLLQMRDRSSIDSLFQIHLTKFFESI